MEKDYTIVAETDEQRQVLKRCMKMYKKYNQEEKIEIIEKLKRNIEITQMPQEHLTIIIAWSIISSFKLYFIEKIGLFPHLILSGEQYTAKTSVADLHTTYLYGHYKEHCGGQTCKSLARFEDIITASTFPRMIDEFEGFSKGIADVLRELATSTSDYKRKTSATTQISRPKVTPIITTSNSLAEFFSQPENSSRAIILEFEKIIKRDPEWIELRNELKKVKLFSLLYDYTKNWKDKELDELMIRANETNNIDEEINRIEKANNGIINVDVNYPRIREIYLIIITGVQLYREVFGIELPLKNVLRTLIKARRNVNRELLERFVEFCKQAKNYTYYDIYEIRKPVYLTVELRWNQRDGYYFQQSHLGGFNSYIRMFGMKPYKKLATLSRELVEALRDKELIRYLNRKVGTNKAQTKVIVISDGLIGIPKEPKYDEL